MSKKMRSRQYLRSFFITKGYGMTLLAFACAFGCAILVARFAVSWVEHQNQARISAQLTQNGHGWVNLHTDGFRVVLTGTTSNHALRTKALSIASTVSGSISVIDKITVIPPGSIPPPEFTIEILYDQSEIILIGLISSELDRAQIIKRAQAIAGNEQVSVVDMLEGVSQTAPENAEKIIDFSLSALQLLEHGKISIRANHITIEAALDTAKAQENFKKIIADTQPDGVNVALNIHTPRPIIAPYELKVIKEGGALKFKACSAESLTDKKILVDAARANDEIHCKIGIGAPSLSWPQIGVSAINALDTFNAGSLSIKNTLITLSADSSTSAQIFNKSLNQLQNRLPKEYTLKATHYTNTLQNQNKTSKPSYAFSASLSPEGNVRLSGQLRDEQNLELINTLAAANFSASKTQTSVSFSKEIPEDWVISVSRGLNALGQLNQGLLVVEPSQLTLRGKSYAPNAQKDISEHHLSALNANMEFVIEVDLLKHAPAKLPLEFTPHECIVKVNDFMAKHKISFEPGSANILQSSAGILDGLVKTLEGCEYVGFEISGHTDSQGRAEMNLRLSKNRAHAVLVALLRRGFDTKNMDAVGYGEEKPIADNETEEGRELNRRISFRLRDDLGEEAHKPAAAE